MNKNINNQIKFVEVPKNKSLGNDPDTCYLQRSDWDDYGFQTTFIVFATNENGELKKLGAISVGKNSYTQGKVELPESPFIQLPTNYFSVGRQAYYEELMGLAKQKRELILKGLKDCADDNKILEEFVAEASFVTSLLRNVRIEDITKLFPSILKGNVMATPYAFKFLLNENEDTSIDVSVIPYSTPPTNMHVLIGRNGIGKTRILSGLADQITKNKNPAEISQFGKIIFPREDNDFLNMEGEGGRFTNLITVVFSAFDHFKPLRNIGDKDSIPCHYIGLKSEDGTSFISPEDLKSIFIKSIDICLSSQRKSRWIEAIKILCSDPIFKEYELEEISLNKSFKEDMSSIFDKLSSGHKIILLTVTRLVELVDDRTLVLIDEPETHLHPPLLSSFMRVISNLLIKRNAVSIIATHSPVVLQEVPKSCVTKIDRVRSEYSLYKPTIETYAENIGTLTRDVFGLEVLESGFHKEISEYLNSDKTYYNLIEEFKDQIGAEGRGIARSIALKNTKKNA
jgi:predicted ATPase